MCPFASFAIFAVGILNRKFAKDATKRPRFCFIVHFCRSGIVIARLSVVKSLLAFVIAIRELHIMIRTL